MIAAQSFSFPLNDLIGQLLKNGLGLTDEWISFDAPDKKWQEGVPQTHMVLDIYLVEFCENLKYRSNEQFLDAGHDKRSPTRLDCRYLISAWSHVTSSPMVAAAAVSPVSEEAGLLYQVTQVLIDNIPLDPVAIYGRQSLPPFFTPDLVSPPFPAVVAPAEPFNKLADFWMRMDSVWKPVVDLVVTFPVAHPPQVAGPAVTTLVAEVGVVDSPRSEELLAIGGTLRVGSPGQPVPGGWIRLKELGVTVGTNAVGQFVFEGLRRGTYTLEGGAPGQPTASPRQISVPSLSGEYDLSLS
jgi:hypothetical protein